MTTDDPIQEWVQRVTFNEHVITETRFRALIQPKPRWLPEKVWWRLVKRVVRVERRS